MASLGKAVDELGLVADVKSKKHGLGHGSLEVLAQYPANLGSLQLLVLLDDHSAHAEIHSHGLAGVERHKTVLNRFAHNGVLVRKWEILHYLADLDGFSGLHVEWHIHVDLDVSHIVSLIELKLLDSTHGFVPLSSEVDVSDGFHDYMLRNVLKFGNALQGDVAPSLAVKTFVDL